MMKYLLLITSMFFVSPVFASIFTGGHGDIGLGEGDELELHLHLHEGTLVDGFPLSEDTEFEPSAAGIAVPNTTATERPAGTAWDFIGNAAGQTFWVLPESHAVAEVQGTPFLGIGAEEVDAGVFANDEITMTLTNVDGPGQFSLYKVELSGPVVFMASIDGISAQDNIIASVGGHAHFNVAFSAPGDYFVTFEVSAIDAASQARVTDEATFTFHVVPEPATLLLLGAGFIGLLRRR